MLKGLTILAALGLAAGPVLADDSVNTGFFGGVAIKGYDPVAYFTENKAVKGSEQYTYEWLGTPWQFSSRKNQELFQSKPEKYAPQYGGYCSGEVAFGGPSFNIDPEAFKIIDGKLYLFSDKLGRTDYVEHLGEYLPKSEKAWPQVKADLEKDAYH